MDPATQSAKVIIEVQSEKLKDGMYLHGAIFTDVFPHAFRLAKAQLNEENTLFLVSNGRLKAKKINPLFIGEDEVITDQLKDGDKVLKGIFMGAFDGARVRTKDDDMSQAENNSTGKAGE